MTQRTFNRLYFGAYFGIHRWVVRHKLELFLSIRMTVAGLLTFVIAAVFGVPNSYWAGLTAIIVTQSSVGSSLKASLERLIGTLAGAAWAIVISSLFASRGTFPESIILTVVIAPLSVLAAVNPAFKAAPITAIIVLLSAAGQHGSTLHVGLERVLDISLGCVIAFAVTLFVLPSRAHRQVAEMAAGALDLVADSMEQIAAGDSAVSQERIRDALGRVEVVADDAKRERESLLTDEPDPDPLVQELRRLINDAEMIERVSIQPLPEQVMIGLAKPRAKATGAIVAFLRASAEALEGDESPPSIDGVENALADYALAVEQLRRNGLAQELSTEDAGRLFGISFALRELKLDLEEFAASARHFSPREN